MAGKLLHIEKSGKVDELLAFSLDDTPLAFSGTVHYLKNQADACRVGVKLVQTSQARTLVQYLHRRQEEILRELQARYEAARHGA